MFLYAVTFDMQVSKGSMCQRCAKLIQDELIWICRVRESDAGLMQKVKQSPSGNPSLHQRYSPSSPQHKCAMPFFLQRFLSSQQFSLYNYVRCTFSILVTLRSTYTSYIYIYSHGLYICGGKAVAEKVCGQCGTGRIKK